MFKFLPILIFLMFMMNPLVASSELSVTKTLILAPHFDDAVLPLGGLLAQDKNQKIVATVFTGKPEQSKRTWWDFISGFVSSNKAVTDRTEENSAALKPFGVAEINFGFLDGQYRKASTTADTKPKLKEKIIELLNDRPQSTHLDVYFPAYFGPKITHIDHLMVHDIVLDLIKSKQFQDISWYMYEDMPYTIVYYKKHKLDLYDYLKQSVPDFNLTQKEILLSGTDLDLMMKSILSYTSQVRAFKFIGSPLKRVVEFAKTHCKDGACEKVYEVSLK